jgi:hypothetical protein
MISSEKHTNLFFFLTIIFGSCLSFSQVLINADSTVDTYALVRSKGLKLEVPDCIHSGKHVYNIWDDELKEYVFAFDSHINLDNDRCRGFDRIRTEMTITDSVPPSFLGAHDGDTFTYTWKFRLDKHFIANPSFSHIHQIKAVGGGDDGMPMITLTTRAGSMEMLQLIFSPAKGNGKEIILNQLNLTQFKGEWIEVIETVTYNINGQFSIVLKKINNGDTLLSYSNNNIGLSRPNAYFYRPKIGIYRSLKNRTIIRDETVRFTDFCIAKGITLCSGESENDIPPEAPIKVAAFSLSNSQILVHWHDNSYNEDLFRIERSSNGSDWSLAALVTSSWERWKPQTQLLSYVDSLLPAGTKYYYRVRAENLYGVSVYSTITSAVPENTGITGGTIPIEFSLQSQPNPLSCQHK